MVTDINLIIQRVFNTIKLQYIEEDIEELIFNKENLLIQKGLKKYKKIGLTFTKQ